MSKGEFHETVRTRELVLVDKEGEQRGRFKCFDDGTVELTMLSPKQRGSSKRVALEMGARADGSSVFWMWNGDHCEIRMEIFEDGHPFLEMTQHGRRYRLDLDFKDMGPSEGDKKKRRG